MPPDQDPAQSYPDPNGAAKRPLHVVQVLPALDAGGVERGTLEVAGALVRAGHRSTVIAAGGRLAESLVKAGSEHLDWPVGEKRLSTLRWIARLRDWLRAERPDILHLRSRLPAWIAYLAWRGLPAQGRPRLVTTVHGPYTVNRYSTVMTRGERVIAVSETIRDYILANYPRIDPARIRVIPRGVSRAEFPYGYRPDSRWQAQWKARFPQLAGRFVVTLPARITRWKGQETFIDLIEALRGDGVDAHGLVVGGIEPRRRAYAEALRARIHARRLDEHISLLGHRSDLREVLAISNAVVSLSNEPEAFGRTTIEALSLGRPVAGYDHGGVGEQLREVFPQGAVKPGDLSGMIWLLTRWANAPSVVPAEHPYTLERMLTATLELYSELARVTETG